MAFKMFLVAKSLVGYWPLGSWSRIYLVCFVYLQVPGLKEFKAHWIYSPRIWYFTVLGLNKIPEVWRISRFTTGAGLDLWSRGSSTGCSRGSWCGHSDTEDKDKISHIFLFLQPSFSKCSVKCVICFCKSVNIFSCQSYIHFSAPIFQNAQMAKTLKRFIHCRRICKNAKSIFVFSQLQQNFLVCQFISRFSISVSELRLFSAPICQSVFRTTSPWQMAKTMKEYNCRQMCPENSFFLSQLQQKLV